MTSKDTQNKAQRVTLFLNRDILKHSKAEAVLKETTLTLLVEEALLQYLPKETLIKKAKI